MLCGEFRILGVSSLQLCYSREQDKAARADEYRDCYFMTEEMLATEVQAVVLEYSQQNPIEQT